MSRSASSVAASNRYYNTCSSSSLLVILLNDYYNDNKEFNQISLLYRVKFTLTEVSVTNVLG